MSKTALSKDFIANCKAQLLRIKQDLLNRSKNSAKNFATIDKHSGDEIDQTVAHIEENSLLINQERLRQQIMEVEWALARIESGTYGVCEETEENIETDRLQAVPWTRLSIEGAEIREAQKRRFAPY